MHRRAFLVGLAAAAGGPSRAAAQPTGRVPVVGMLVIATREQTAHFVGAFEDGMRALGYVPGRNVVYAHRFANGHAERLPELAADMVRSKVDVIVTGSVQQTIVAKKATSTVPIVMAMAIQPVTFGLIESLARPGGNLTGLTGDVGPDIAAKRLEILKEVVPHVRRIGILRDPAYPWPESNRQAEDDAARQLGVNLHRIDVATAEDFDRALADVERRGIQALTMTAAALFFGNRARLTALIAKSRLPVLYSQREFPDAGGLMSYGTNSTDLCRRAAAYVDRILKGARPGELPVEQPTKFELVINLKVAKMLGLTIPPSLLLRADQVIE